MATPQTLTRTLAFPEAVPHLLDQRKLRRESWPNHDDCIYLFGGLLKIRRDGMQHDLILAETDLVADDWVVVRDI